VGPSGLVGFIGYLNPDLTVGAIAWRRFAPKLPGRYPDASGPSPYLSQRERRKSLPVLTPLLFRDGYSNLPLRCYTSTLCLRISGTVRQINGQK
jgi:hypothetical protein